MLHAHDWYHGTPARRLQECGEPSSRASRCLRTGFFQSYTEVLQYTALCAYANGLNSGSPALLPAPWLAASGRNGCHALAGVNSRGGPTSENSDDIDRCL